MADKHVEQLRSGNEKFVAIEAKPELVARMREKMIFYS